MLRRKVEVVRKYVSVCVISAMATMEEEVIEGAMGRSIGRAFQGKERANSSA